MFLDRITRRPGHGGEGFPWTVPLIAGLTELVFTTPVTFLVGENGCGKSTLLEGLAWGTDAVAVGGRPLATDPTLAGARRFPESFTFARSRRARTRLFLRAEDVFGFTGRIGAEMAGLRQDAEEVGAALAPGYGRDRALRTIRGSADAFASTYGDDPDGRSHGEVFLRVLQARLRPDGLFFLDEPETPLSPSRVLALITILQAAVAAGGQFVVATHSPMLLALPGATILEVSGATLRPVAWDDLEHVRVTRAFLNDPGAVLRRLRD